MKPNSDVEDTAAVTEVEDTAAVTDAEDTVEVTDEVSQISQELSHDFSRTRFRTWRFRTWEILRITRERINEGIIK